MKKIVPDLYRTTKIWGPPGTGKTYRLLKILKEKLVAHGRLHIATDWEDYAEYIRELTNNDSGLINLAGENNFSPRPLWRTETRYECRGKKLEHKVWDFCYGLK